MHLFKPRNKSEKTHAPPFERFCPPPPPADEVKVTAPPPGPSRFFSRPTREQAKFTLRVLASPRLESLVNLCREPSEGKEAGAHPPRRFLLVRDSPVDKTIAGGIIGIIYAGFAIGYTTASARGRQPGMFQEHRGEETFRVCNHRGWRPAENHPGGL